MFVTQPKNKNKSISLLKTTNSILKPSRTYSIGHKFSSDYTFTKSINKWIHQRKTLQHQPNFFNKAKFSHISHKISTLIDPKATQLKHKWHKIVDLYKGTNLLSTNNKKIQPGIQFYELLANEEIIDKHPLNINLPQTILMDSYGEMKMAYTHPQTKLITLKPIQKHQYVDVLQEMNRKVLNQLKKNNFKYRKYYDFKQNQYAPFLVSKSADDGEVEFEVDVETFKIFQQKKTRPNQNRLIQRYVYSRNMKAMIMRFCYEKNGPNEQKQEIYGYRFQNIDDIFRPNQKNTEIMQSNKLTSVIYLTYQRENKINYTKIITRNGLTKFIQPSQNIIRFIESVHHVRVNKIYIDFIVDLFDQPWFINLKLIEAEDIKYNNAFLHNTIENKICCKICLAPCEQNQSKKHASNKMVIQFLDHLKKRIKIEDYDKLDFFKNIHKISKREHKTFKICEGCYMLISEQFHLIECQKKLASICSIKLKNQGLYPLGNHLAAPERILRQWRLMFFLKDITNLPQSIVSGQFLHIKLALNEDLQEKWTIKLEKHKNATYNLNANKIKISYFFSQTKDISQFLQQTKINLRVLNEGHEQFIAHGETSILSTLQNNSQYSMCLRQTFNLLLLCKNHAYCSATIKVGLIYDGRYAVPQNVGLKEVQKVNFAQGYINSNPIPKQWMEAFDLNQQYEQTSEQTFEQILHKRRNELFKKQSIGNESRVKTRSKLLRRSICHK